MSWITKFEHKYDNLEAVFDKFNEDAMDIDILDDNASNAVDSPQMSEACKMLNLMLATASPFLFCLVYVACLKIITMLLERG